MNRYRLAGALSALLLAAALTGCGDDDADELQPAAPELTDATVTTADSDLGVILTDGAGHTLYLFTMDSPGTSACEGECLQAWPILGGEATAGEGVDADLLGTIDRDDGTAQATYNDWPLYYFAEDAEPGDLAGQGVNEVWWVIDPAGNAIEQLPATDSGGSGRDY